MVPASEKLTTVTLASATPSGEVTCVTKSAAIRNAVTVAFAETKLACAKKDLPAGLVPCESVRKTVWGMAVVYRQASANVIQVTKAQAALSAM